MTIPSPTSWKNTLKTIIPVGFIVVGVVSTLFLLRGFAIHQGASAPANDSVNQTPAEVGSILPDFQLFSLSSQPSKLTDIHSKVTLMNFWATWCEACMDEMPSLVRLRDEYKDKGFEVVGINLDENATLSVPKAVKDLHIGFPIFRDPENKVADFFDVHAIPLSVVFGADRKILYIENGERNWNDQETRHKLEKWLAGT
jgi:thiol-disulfide isomerase/thioredoxin